MKQLVRAYQNVLYAEDKINQKIEEGWKVKSITMSHGHYHNGCSRDAHYITEKVIVLFEREEPSSGK